MMQMRKILDIDPEFEFYSIGIRFSYTDSNSFKALITFHAHFVSEYFFAFIFLPMWYADNLASNAPG